jgi:hypothetical protein
MTWRSSPDQEMLRTHVQKHANAKGIGPINTFTGLTPVGWTGTDETFAKEVATPCHTITHRTWPASCFLSWPTISNYEAYDGFF